MVAKVSFSIDGKFGDVYPYMDYLLLLTQDYELRVVDWASWAHRIADAHPDESGLIRAALFDNRELSNFELPDEWATLDVGDVPDDLVVFKTSLAATSCADWLVYNRTLYFATSTNVWMMPLVINGHFDGALPPQEIVDSRAFHMRAKFGLITVACGLDGLAARGAYVWSFQDVPHVEPTHYSDLRTDRIGWMKEHVLSISEDRASMLFNSLAKANFGTLAQFEGENRSITQFGYFRRDSQELLSGQFPTFRRGFTSNNRFYSWTASSVAVAGFTTTPAESQLVLVNSFTLPVETIFEGSSFERGLVFDTDDGTYFSNAAFPAPERIAEEENVIVRTFTQAVRYTRQIWSVKEDRIQIDVL